MLALLVPLLLAATPVCRTSGTGEEQPLDVSRDLDGDGVADRLQRSSGGGSGESTTNVTLTLSSRPEPLELSQSVSFYGFVSLHPIPEPLLAPQLAGARRAVEDALFDTTCDAPDPSLQWLLDERHRLRWIPGPPVLPGGYAVPSAELSLRKTVQKAERAEHGGAAGPLPELVWVLYLGHNHGRTLSGGQPGMLTAPVELARRGERSLLGTAHSVILAEPTRHAWIFVQPGGQKLRIPSIASARFDGQTAVIELSLAQTQDQGTARVDLKSGALLGVKWRPDEAAEGARDDGTPRGR